MCNAHERLTRTGRRPIIGFVIKGHLAAHWAEWFDGMTITPLDNGETLIEGPIVDQAALHGMLNHIRDLGLPLLAVDRIEPDDDRNRERR